MATLIYNLSLIRRNALGKSDNRVCIFLFLLKVENAFKAKSNHIKLFKSINNTRACKRSIMLFVKTNHTQTEEINHLIISRQYLCKKILSFK